MSTTWRSDWSGRFGHEKVKTAGVMASRGSGPEREGVGALEGLRHARHGR